MQQVQKRFVLFAEVSKGELPRLVIATNLLVPLPQLLLGCHGLGKSERPPVLIHN